MATAKNRFPLYIIGLLLLVVGIFLFTTYNSLVPKDENVNLKWNEVQNAYQRRLDLIPNLVQTVKGGAEYEQITLTKIAAARGSMAGGGRITPEAANRQMADQAAVATSVNNLIARVERYPELKGTEAFQGLQVQLEGTERRIKFARKDFNEAINIYNTSVRSFPTNLAAGLFGFKPRTGFQADDGSQNAVEIKF